MAWFRPTVLAICETIATSHAKAQAFALDPPYDDIADFVTACFDDMPRLLACGLQAFTALLATSAIVYGGRPFWANEPAARRRQWLRWQSHPFSPCRDFVRFYESLATLALYSRPQPAIGRRS